MKTPLFSVCIPAWNAAGHIEETVRSVLNSTYPNFEIIVNDDESSDDTVERIRAFRDGRISISINDKNLGVPANWNASLTRARGEWICFLNHDDMVSPFWLEYAGRIFQKHRNVDWILSAFRVIGDDESEKGPRIIRRFSENRVYPPAEVFPVAILQDGFSPGFCIRSRALAVLRGFDESIGPSADNELFIRLGARFDMFFSTTPHTFWRSHGDGLTRRWSSRDQVREGLRILRKTFHESELPEPFPQYRDRAYRYFYYKICLRLASLAKQENDPEFRAVFAILAEDIEANDPCRTGPCPEKHRS